MKLPVFTVAVLVQGIACLRLFDSKEQLPANMTGDCKDALTSDMRCGPRLIKPGEVARRLPSDTEQLDQYCGDPCVQSMKQWVASVHDCCGDELFDFGWSAIQGGEPFKQSASDIADALVWAQGVACLKEEETGKYCGTILTNGTMEKCGDCTLKYLAAMLSSWYGLGEAPSKKGFQRLLETCCVDPAKYPHQNWTAPELPRPTGVRNITCYGGCYYTVKENDTCQSIAYGFGVSHNQFLYQNGLDWNCHGLKAGREACVGNPCSLYIVQENDTCDSIIKKNSFTLTELLAWNPTIHGTCDNLSVMKGRTICISPPGAESYDVNVTVSWAQQPWSRPSGGSWLPAPTRADSNVAATTATKKLRLRDVMPTPTFVYNATAEKRQAELLARYCPVTQDDLEKGFQWYYLTHRCHELLGLYCNPQIDGSEPMGLPQVPNECRPAAVMGW